MKKEIRLQGKKVVLVVATAIALASAMQPTVFSGAVKTYAAEAKNNEKLFVKKLLTNPEFGIKLIKKIANQKVNKKKFSKVYSWINEALAIYKKDNIKQFVKEGKITKKWKKYQKSLYKLISKHTVVEKKKNGDVSLKLNNGTMIEVIKPVTPYFEIKVKKVNKVSDTKNVSSEGKNKKMPSTEVNNDEKHLEENKSHEKHSNKEKKNENHTEEVKHHEVPSNEEKKNENHTEEVKHHEVPSNEEKKNENHTEEAGHHEAPSNEEKKNENHTEENKHHETSSTGNTTGSSYSSGEETRSTETELEKAERLAREAEEKYAELERRQVSPNVTDAQEAERLEKEKQKAWEEADRRQEELSKLRDREDRKNGRPAPPPEADQP